MAAERRGMRALHGAAQELERHRPFALISACLGVDAASADASRARVAEVLRGDARYGLPGVRSETAEADSPPSRRCSAWSRTCAHRGRWRCSSMTSSGPTRRACWCCTGWSVRCTNCRFWWSGLTGRCPEPGKPTSCHGARSRPPHRLELAPLEPARRVGPAGGPVRRRPGPRLRRMAEGAAGNPLYITELTAALLREHAIEIRGGIAEVAAGSPLPPLTALVTHRLRYLRDEVVQALRVASVLGAGCTVTDLAAVLDRPLHELLAVMAEAEAAGVLRDTGERLRLPP